MKIVRRNFETIKSNYTMLGFEYVPRITYERKRTMWKRFGNEFDWEDEVDVFNAIVIYMDDDIREKVHMELAPCTNRLFIERYIELDPEFEQLLTEEFGIERY